MGTAAERYTKAGEAAEERRQFDVAADAFFLSARHFQADRKVVEANEMAERGKRSLDRTILLADSALEYETQAARLADHAFALDETAGTAPHHATTELYSLTSDLYESAAQRFIALAEQARSSMRKGYFLGKAAEDLEKTGQNLSTAACRNRSWELESRSQGLLEKAALLRAQAKRLVVLGLSLPDDDPEVCKRITLTWLARLARPKCKGCNRVWGEYVENSRRCIALMRKGEIVAAAGGAGIQREFWAAAEWQRIAMEAVLDHEQAHQHKENKKAAQGHAASAMILSRAS